jgi:hypothetical protein
MFKRAISRVFKAEINSQHQVFIGQAPPVQYDFMKGGNHKIALKQLELSRYSLEKSENSILQLTNYEDYVAVVFKITENTSVVVYKIEDVEDVSDEVSKTSSLLEDREDAEAKSFHKELRLWHEVDRNFFNDEKLWFTFFYNAEYLCFVLNTKLVFYSLSDAVSFEVPIKEFEKHGGSLREFEYDRLNQRLMFRFGNSVSMIMFAIKGLKVAGYLELKGIESNFVEMGKNGKIELEDGELEEELLTISDVEMNRSIETNFESKSSGLI